MDSERDIRTQCYKEKQMNNFFNGLGIFVFSIGAIVGGTLFNGFVLKVIWNWFAAPYFGLYPMTVTIAISKFIREGVMKCSQKL